MIPLIVVIVTIIYEAHSSGLILVFSTLITLLSAASTRISVLLFFFLRYPSDIGEWIAHQVILIMFC